MLSREYFKYYIVKSIYIYAMKILNKTNIIYYSPTTVKPELSTSESLPNLSEKKESPPPVVETKKEIQSISYEWVYNII